MRSSQDRNLFIALYEIARLSSQLRIPKIIREMAAMLYRQALKKDIIRGHSIDSIAAASVYAACRAWKIPRKLSEIAQYSRINCKEIGRSYRLMRRRLKITIPVVSPADFIPRFSTALILPEKVQQNAIKIIKLAHKKGLTAGRNPAGLAAAAIYIASLLEGDHRTQHQITKVAGVTEVTLRNRYKEFIKKLNIDL